jgi:hypothetical protein
MTLLASLAGLCGVVLSALVFAGFGQFLLTRARLSLESRAERLLVSLAVGVVALELLVSLGELAKNSRVGVLAALGVVGILGLFGLPAVVRNSLAILRELLRLAGIERWLALSLGGVLFLEGFAAMAPLTGSDALHYHFTAMALILRDGFHVNWFMSHALLTGLSHQLILAGLAIGSEKLALGWIFLGGAAAALAAAQLTRQWVSGPWPWLTALIFLLTPVVFWQITTSGAPDIWMDFFLPLGVILTAKAKEQSTSALAILAGVLAGSVAGAKYTGLIFAACLFLAFLWEVRVLRSAALFFSSAVFAGIWPFLRNWIWSGDPVFPFLLPYIAPSRVNHTAIVTYVAGTGAQGPRDFWQIVRFPLFAAVDQAHLGFWQFLGPLVLCLAPLTFLALRNTPIWRTALIVWIGGALGIGLTSEMARYALPVLPIALAASMAGVAHMQARPWRAVRVTALASIAAFLLFGLGGLALYARNAWAVSGGLVPRERYLLLHAPDYARAEFVNQQLAGKGSEGKVLVFFQHLYYLRVPFVYGDPEASWAMDPAKLQTDDAWLALFRSQRIRWVVRAPDYPESLSKALERLETEKILVPCSAGEVQDWVGNRIGGARELQPITILCVQD